MRRQGLGDQLFEAGGGREVGQIDGRGADQLGRPDEDQSIAHQGEADLIDGLSRQRVEGRRVAQREVGAGDTVFIDANGKPQALEKRAIHEREDDSVDEVSATF